MCSAEGKCVPENGVPDAPIIQDVPRGEAMLTLDRSDWDFGTIVLGQSGSSVTFTVTNHGTAAAPPIDVSMIGARATAFVIDPQSSCLGAALTAAASCTINVSFRPDATGMLTADLMIGDQVAASLAGQGLPPGQVVLTPTSADFGAVVEGKDGAAVELTLKNSGGAPTGALAVTVSGASAGDFTIATDGCSDKMLAAGANCKVGLVFHPSAVGGRTATLGITATPGGAQTAMLVGRGLAPATLEVEPPALDLGTTVSGTTAEATLTVTNPGGVATGTVSTVLSGDAATEYAVTKDDCAGTSIAAGASCTVTVEARPASPGTKAATLTFTAADPGGTVAATLTTMAVPPGALAATPAKVSYAGALLDSDGETHTVTVKNTGGAATGAVATALSGTGKSQFHIADDACSGKTLAPAGTCTLTIRFHPTARQAQNATLSITSSPGGTATVSLTGTGLAPAALAGDATTIAFGTIDVGQTSAAQTLTITNGGDVATGALSLDVAGDTSEFVVDNACGTDPLAPGASCTVAVALAPTSGGMKSVTLTVSGTPGGSVALMAQGTGRPPSKLSVSLMGNGHGSVGSDPDGVSCGTGCDADYLYGTSVTLTATPATGSAFTGWAGGCTGTGPCILVMNGDQTVTATFTLIRLPVTVDVTGSGTVTSMPAGVNCGSACSASYDYGSTVTLTAAPATGSSFSGWTGCPMANGATCTVPLTQAAHISAAFTVNQIPVTVAVTGNGTVTSAPAGINCGSACMASFTYGQSITLTAAPAANQHFVGWMGACAGTATTCTVTPGTSPLTIGASFAVDTHVLTVTNAGGGTVVSSPAGVSCGSSCSASFNHGQVVTLTATPSSGYRFGSFGGACSGGSPCTVTMDAAKSVTASFTRQFTLTVTPPTHGTVTGSGINCGTGGSACSVLLDSASSATLSQSAAAGYGFAGWGGACSGIGGCTVAMTQDQTVTASFTQETLTVATPANGSVTGNGISCPGTCSSAYAHGSSVTLTAAPAAHYHFTGWGGDCSGTSTCTVTMDRTRNVSASFAIDTASLTVTNAGGGTVGSSPAGINCGSSCSASFNFGKVVTLTATPAAGYRFDGFGGACSGGSPCTVTVDGAKTVTASFIRQVTLTINPTPANGTIQAPGLNCGVGGTACSTTVDTGTSITLHPTPATGYNFAGWSGACSGTGACTLSVTQDQAASATFSLQSIALSVFTTGSGSVTCNGTTCASNYPYGTSVTLALSAGTGYSVGPWGGDCSGTGTGQSCVVQMTAPRSVSATFNVNSYTLSFSAHSGNAWGWVTSNVGGIDCGLGMYVNIFNPQHTVCSASIPYGTTVTVTAHAAQDSEAYVGAWAGCTSASGATCQILIDGNRTATPNFYGDGVDVTYQSIPDSFGAYGTGTVTSTPTGLDCGDNPSFFNVCRWRYHWSSTVVLRYNLDSGGFNGWTGCDSLQDRNDGTGGFDCVVGAFGTRSVTATFIGNTIF